MHKKEIPSFSLKLGNSNIKKVDDFNYLGLTVDTNLNWKKHTEKVANRCSKKIGVLNRLKYVLPLCIKTMLYKHADITTHYIWHNGVGIPKK